MEKRIKLQFKNNPTMSGVLIIILALSLALQYFWNSAPFGMRGGSPAKTVALVPDFNTATTRLSRAEINSQIIRLTDQIQTLERKNSIKGPMGVVIYSAETTNRLAHNYQQIQLREDYLAQGRADIKENAAIRWEDYLLKAGKNRPFSVSEIEKSLQALKEYPWAANFLTGFRIFALPYTIPDVSGLGGAGFSLLSAAEDKSESQISLNEQLRVTLYHEIGHHLHLSVMPDDTATGKNLWGEYLSLRGGTWHGPGQVKTPAWGNSSEETFAEDFRMLFGKDQPYYGDISLGDPRTDPNRAEKIRVFIENLVKKPMAVGYESPWIPNDLVLLEVQPVFIAGVWILLGVATMIFNPRQAGIPKRTTVVSNFANAV